MEGPYRDLGAGFARLLGAEGLRRSPGRLRSVEDALFELLRNSRDAGARNVYVASSLGTRRYRTLVVIDDGRGIPETHKHLVFEPGVTTRHLNPVPEAPSQELPRTHAPHGAGLSLYHVKNTSLSAEVLSAFSPTAIKVVFDTRSLPEKHLQSNARPSKTNLPATLTRFLTPLPRFSLPHTLPSPKKPHNTNEPTESGERWGGATRAGGGVGVGVGGIVEDGTEGSCWYDLRGAGGDGRWRHRGA
ncbi:MAG: ATP-binding protein [Actinobacteria bacterium]|nr:ATP-binding protein [Actinomycetota bacterium]